MAQYRNAAVLGDITHEIARATRNDHIDFARQLEHFADLFAGVEQVYCMPWNIREMRERVAPNRDEGLIAVHRFDPAFEDYGIARLQRQGGDLRDDLGSRFENDTYDTERPTLSVVSASSNSVTQLAAQGAAVPLPRALLPPLRDHALVDPNRSNTPRHRPASTARWPHHIALVGRKDF